LRADLEENIDSGSMGHMNFWGFGLKIGILRRLNGGTSSDFQRTLGFKITRSVYK